MTSPASTPVARLHQIVSRVHDAAGGFARLSLRERLALVGSMQAGYVTIAARSVRAGCQAKGITPGTPGEGEEWITGPCCVVRQLRLIGESLAALERRGNTPVGRIGATVDGRLSAEVFPTNRREKAFFQNVRGEIHLRAGMTEGDLHASRARFYKQPDHAGRVVLVLGAGNGHAIPVGDVITKLFNEGKVCVLKMHPVNAYLGPFIEEAFAEAIARHYLAVVYGDAEEGAYLVNHPCVEEIHITGSDKTFELLVWGPPGPERAARIASGKPLLPKVVTSELGNISPVIVVPGPYTDKELAFQAESIAGAVAQNASFNCNAAKLLVTPRGWRLRDPLLDGIEKALLHCGLRQAYYPGAAERWHACTAGRTGVRTIGEATEGTLPWTIVSGLDAERADDPAFATEPFCPVLFETSLGSTDPLEFLERAVAFVNERLWGSLVATLIVHPRTTSDRRVADAVERAIGKLRYGGVAINVWPGLIYFTGTMPWGGYPGATGADIQSGCGWTHNTSMIDGIEKAVIRHPLTSFVRAPYFPTHRTAHVLGRAMTRYEARDSWARLAPVMMAALRG